MSVKKSASLKKKTPPKEKDSTKETGSQGIWGTVNHILEAEWTTENKAAESGSRVVLVNPKNTTQFCSRCGQYVRKELSDRIHSCPSCGLVMNRDQNAAINILRLGLQSLSACHAHE